MRTTEEVKHAFRPVGKLGEAKKVNLMHFENAFIDIANDIVTRLPETADRTSALRKLLDAKMTLTQAITHGKDLTELVGVKNG